MTQFKSEMKDGMRIDWDVPIEMDDGVVLRSDIFRPVEEGHYPVIMNYGVYGKWIAFQDDRPEPWKRMIEEHPDVPAGSTNKYQHWEVVDPEKWVPDGYICLRIDSRGAGRSPGYFEPFSPRETKDLYNCIEWAARQSWSNGKIGLNGISYYAMNQWQVACLKPPHLAAICAWEGAADYYRDFGHHGGIFCNYIANWYEKRSTTKQHGLGERGYKSRMTGDWVSGPETLTDEALKANRCDLAQDVFDHALFDDYWQARIPDWSKVTVPLLSAANWGGKGYTRGETSRVLCGQPLNRSGSKCMDSSTGHISIPIMASSCRSVSLAISSRVRTRAGTASRACSCRYAIPKKSLSNATNMNGRLRAPYGRSFTSNPRIKASTPDHPRPMAPLLTKDLATA